MLNVLPTPTISLFPPADSRDNRSRRKPNTMSKLHPNTHATQSTSGSALIVVLILCTAIGMVITFILRNSVTEKRLNEYYLLSMNSRNAAESIVDYGVGQLTERWRTQVTFQSEELAPTSSKALTIKSELKDFLGAGNIDSESLVLLGGVIPPNALFYINPDDEANQFDPHKGKWVLARNVEILGRATASHASIGKHTAYAKQTLQLRDAPLFSHAIFYNMDLEFHPGATMDIDGPVHSNGNIWAVGKSYLNFTSVVTTAMDFRVSMMREPYQGDWSSWSAESSQSGNNVRFKDADGNYLSPYRGSGATNVESSFYSSVSDSFGSGYDNWADFSINRWVGNLQTKDHGIKILNPIGYGDYVPDYDGSTTMANPAYAIIEPNLPASHPYNKGMGEEEKFARKAGLIMRVHRDLVDNSTGVGNTDPTDPFYPGDGIDDDRGTALPAQAVRLRRRPDGEDSWSIASNATWVGYHTTYLTAYDAWLASTDSDGDGIPDASKPIYNPPSNPYDTSYYLSFAMLSRVSSTEPNSALILNTVTVTRVDVHGDSYEEDVTEVIEKAVLMDSSFGLNASTYSDLTAFREFLASQAAGAVLRREFDEMFAAHPFMDESIDNVDYNGDGDKSDLFSGMVDQRVAHGGSSGDTEKARISMIEVNLAAFARQVEDRNGDTFENYYMPHRYNGVVYMEFPTDTSHTPRSSDNVLKSIDGMAVVLTEAGGSTGKIPDPAYNIDQPNRDRGLCFATNSALYTLGNFNADGNLLTPGSSYVFTESDDPDNPDPPVAIAADAVSMLSSNFKFYKSKSTSLTDASNTEFCAALVAGLVPTNKGGDTSTVSGGAHNFPRFLERWSGKTFRYRGSIVALFESEVQNQEFGSSSYYSPPTRQYGFFAEFKKGNYPPGTPYVRSYRKIDFRYLTAEEFEDSIADLPWSVTLP